MRRNSINKVDEIYKQSVQQSLKQFQKPSSSSSNQRILHEGYNYWVIKYALFLSNVSSHYEYYILCVKLTFTRVASATHLWFSRSENFIREKLLEDSQIVYRTRK